MDTLPLEWCREWIEDKANYCYEPATVIIWGRLFPSKARGPRCTNHAMQHVDWSHLDQWAVFDLRGLVRKGNG